MSYERLALNNALAKLTEGWDEKSARIVIDFGNKIPGMSTITYQRFEKSQNDKSISGFTKECGNITVKGSCPEEVIEKTYGIKQERIGHFKLHKQREGVLIFHNFWASDIFTKSENRGYPLKYVLEYDIKTLTPLALSVMEKKELYTFFIITRLVEIPIPIYGNPKFEGLRGWIIRL